ncbi:6-phosphogluconolactonase [Posidoniimonas polymericola]|uniref:6-phosphogluconolactonase n=1 Tax=Posidoniimonas polymericola TaxID=2528002 RepID=A0A5C5XVF6_9BACT|nr:lactonase family protein [Posidoniimonas polymericola]TWT66870.1 6-phosphogluconolactonase [Posidoniimonas polymericola]
MLCTPSILLRQSLVATIGLLSVCLQTPSARSGEQVELTAYVGTYTGQTTRGIYRLDVAIDGDQVEGAADLVAETENPSYLTLTADRQRVYAVGEITDYQGKQAGKLIAYRREDDGRLAKLNEVAVCGGAPCYVSLDRDERFALVANYADGTVCSLPILASGELGAVASSRQHAGSSVIKNRQQGPHAHCVVADPTNRFVLATDLGADKIFVYRFDAKTGELTPHDPPALAMPPGSGPRHLTFHPNGRLAVVINELNGTLTSMSWDADSGRLAIVDSESTLPPNVKQKSCADVHVHPNGRFVYGSNRGHDSIAVFAIDASTGELDPVDHVPARVKTPRNIALTPSGDYLFAGGQYSGDISVFAVDPESGGLEPVGELFAAPTPVCIRFAGRE